MIREYFDLFWSLSFLRSQSRGRRDNLFSYLALFVFFPKIDTLSNQIYGARNETMYSTTPPLSFEKVTAVDLYLPDRPTLS